MKRQESPASDAEYFSPYSKFRIQVGRPVSLSPLAQTGAPEIGDLGCLRTELAEQRTGSEHPHGLAA